MFTFLVEPVFGDIFLVRPPWLYIEKLSQESSCAIFLGGGDGDAVARAQWLNLGTKSKSV